MTAPARFQFPPEGSAPVAEAPMRLGFLCPHNALDRQAFSGTPFYAARALEAHPAIELRLLGAHRRPGVVDRLRSRLLPRRINAIDPAPPEFTGCDAVVGLVATPLLDKLRRACDLPYLHVTDATPAFLREDYGWDVPEHADLLESAVARDAAAVVYSSHPIAARAARDLGLAGFRPLTVPFGVNFEVLPTERPEKPEIAPLKLLFVGKDWARKGGDMAIALLNQLRSAGRDAELTVVGGLPDRHRGCAGVTNAGFLDKNRLTDSVRLAQLYREAHLLVLPTRADCAPMVIGEAMAHGTPVIASDTGGVSHMIGLGNAGVVLPHDAEAAQWAGAVSELTTDAASYLRASEAAFERAHKTLSWEAWADGIAAIARDAISRKVAQAA